jgi:hypothetical protein
MLLYCILTETPAVHHRHVRDGAFHGPAHDRRSVRPSLEEQDRLLLVSGESAFEGRRLG